MNHLGKQGWLGIALGFGLACCQIESKADQVMASGVALQQKQLICRWDRQAWRACKMKRHRQGMNWEFNLAEHNIQIQHDGSGVMQIRQSDAGHWTRVEPRWDDEHTLCWGPLCTRGAIPLD